MSVQLTDIITSVRELTFDRFCVPAFMLKAKPGYTITIVQGNTNTLVLGHTSSPITIQLKANGVFKTLQDLTRELATNNVVFAYTPYFTGKEPASALIPIASTSLAEDKTIYKYDFFSDSTINEMIIWYYYQVLNITLEEADLETAIPLLIYPSEKHLCYWVSYKLVDRRRSYEAASILLGNTFSDGSNFESMPTTSNSQSTTTTIGSVFSITEDPDKGFLYEDFNRIGSDNVWGDKHSFWFKLMLFLRSKLEDEFADFSLRPDTVMTSNSILEKPLNIRAYYDSYPFTLSPLSRGLLT